MAALIPRIVIVTRPTEYEGLLARFGTAAQARFSLESIGIDFEPLVRRHELVISSIETVARAIPREWRRARVTRSELDRFIFEPEDVLVPIGQDGLVANVAKYLTGQRVVGVNPDPASYEGVLARHAPHRAGALLRAVVLGEAPSDFRTMVEARLEDGQQIRALNEIFVGHRSHQSARYRIRLNEREERQSSSGLIVATGTGSTGWARSIQAERQSSIALPLPADPQLSVFVREAFPGSGFGATLTEALLSRGDTMELLSEMPEGGVIFGDGLEDDRLDFGWGSRLELSIASERLVLVNDTDDSRDRVAA